MRINSSSSCSINKQQIENDRSKRYFAHQYNQTKIITGNNNNDKMNSKKDRKRDREQKKLKSDRYLFKCEM